MQMLTKTGIKKQKKLQQWSVVVPESSDLTLLPLQWHDLHYLCCEEQYWANILEKKKKKSHTPIQTKQLLAVYFNFFSSAFGSLGAFCGLSSTNPHAGPLNSSSFIASQVSNWTRGKSVSHGESYRTRKLWLSTIERGHHMDGWPFRARLCAPIVVKFPRKESKSVQTLYSTKDLRVWP